MKPPKSRHIRRVDDSRRGTHAWFVTVQRHNRINTKMFSDGVWGGKRKALEAARTWRDQHLQAEHEHQLWRRNRLRRNNRSGLVGVARYERKSGTDGRSSGGAYWLASWIDSKGTSRKRKFSVRLWGEEGAKTKAIEVRTMQILLAVAERIEQGR